MLPPIVNRIAYFLGTVIIFVYRKEIIMICIGLFCACVAWMSFEAYRIVSRWLSYFQFKSFSEMPSFIFEYPPDVQSCPKHNRLSFNKKQSVGNVAFETIDTFAKCLQVQFK